VQVGSALAYRGIPLQAAYCGTKFAIRGFTDSLRTELLHEGSAVQLPALNTPQLDWCRTALPNRPQPVPPIFRPEVAARSIWEAAHQRRRELWVGGPTWKAILGNRVAPWFADRVQVRKGCRAQQTEQPLARDRRDDRWRPVPGDHGAHGRFAPPRPRTQPAQPPATLVGPHGEPPANRALARGTSRSNEPPPRLDARPQLARTSGPWAREGRRRARPGRSVGIAPRSGRRHFPRQPWR
jgi:hypothetical protein